MKSPGRGEASKWKTKVGANIKGRVSSLAIGLDEGIQPFVKCILEEQLFELEKDVGCDHLAEVGVRVYLLGLEDRST